MIQDRTCRTCQTIFPGGPRAYYCPVCRAERTRQTNAEHKARARRGLVRRLGSIDKCERCGKPYTVEGGNQRFCPDCQPVHALEYDRETSLPFYHDNKDRINPVRNERRRIGLINCKICGTEFDPEGTSRLFCTDACRVENIRREWRKNYHAERGSSEIKRCKICGESFIPASRRVTCSPDCYAENKRSIAREYWRRKQKERGE